MQRGSPCWCPEGTRATSMHHPMRWQCLCPLWPSQRRCRRCCSGGSEVVASCREAVPVGVQRAQRRHQRIIQCTGSAFATSGHPTVIVLGVAVVDLRWQHHAERQSLLASSERKGDANASSDALALPFPPLVIPALLPRPCTERQWGGSEAEALCKEAEALCREAVPVGVQRAQR
jgi:hypothetical protein